MSSRRRVLAVVVAAVIGGLCFAPVFGVRSLLLPVLAVGVIVFVVTELCRAIAALAPWRPLLLALAGLLTIAETVLRATTVAGLPTAATVRSLGRGLTAWQSTLESTWPARPDPDLVVFVPMLVLLTALLGVELLGRVPALGAMVPAFALAGVGQAYVALTGVAAVVVACGYGLVVAAVLVPERAAGRAWSAAQSDRGRSGRVWSAAPADRGRKSRHDRSRLVTLLPATALLVVVAVAGAAAFAAVDPLGRTPYTLQKVQSSTTQNARLPSPLTDLAGRLTRTNAPKAVFRFRSDTPVDRWRLIALEEFDGVSWTTGQPLLRLGSELAPGAEVRVPVNRRSARVELDGLKGPWLPSQALPAAVRGPADPLIEPVGGTLMTSEPPDRYELSWFEPAIDSAFLLRAGIDPDVPEGLGDLGAMPNEVAVLAQEALAGSQATFATALALERYLQTNYKVAVRDPLPSGHSWPQLRRFLIDREPGTSEQFAAAYVAMARANGIPARLVVGFRTPAKPDSDGWYTVRNADALAWPEVAVDGVGWLPLDPSGQAQEGKPVVPGSTADVTEQARKEVPPVDQLEDPVVEPPPPAAAPGRTWSFTVPVAEVFVVSSGLLLLWLLGVPFGKWLRATIRRRRTGTAAVVGAWAEVRDRLRAFGVPVVPGTTVRELAAAASAYTDERSVAGLATVAECVDAALWSGAPADPELARRAWSGVAEVKRGLRSRPWTERAQAALEFRSLFSWRPGRLPRLSVRGGRWRRAAAGVR